MYAYMYICDGDNNSQHDTSAYFCYFPSAVRLYSILFNTLLNTHLVLVMKLYIATFFNSVFDRHLVLEI